MPIASWRRLIRSPDVRSKLGIETPGDQLKILAKEEDVSKALTYVAKDLATGRVRTVDIYTKEDRVRYAESLPKSIAVTPILKSGEGVDIGTDVPDRKTKPAKARPRPPRAKLIPIDCVLEMLLAISEWEPCRASVTEGSRANSRRIVATHSESRPSALTTASSICWRTGSSCIWGRGCSVSFCSQPNQLLSRSRSAAP